MTEAPSGAHSHDARAWSDLADHVEAVLTDLRPDRFLVIEYIAARRWDPCPYVQCARDADGWYCEVVSENYLGRADWPIDELFLRRSGWAPPDETTQNWWRVEGGPARAASVLVDGLRDGRACPDPDAFFWSIGTFPSGGPGGGEPRPLPRDEQVSEPIAA